MAEYIEKGAAKRAVDWAIELNNTEYGDVCNEIDKVPAADVAPVRHGKWEVMANTKTRRICSCCGWDVPEYGKFYSYCPNCGADMRGAK